ncbi:hypothetical protein PRIPAC_98017 [Pristionchus pacificus]|uniref:Ech-3 n=1 Tax=Pristionchus pacificus TaxID=54126 RepID=A0A8R1Z668_PRIPA|nr:hypothetical protein PRIPAC_98017 [Pristionchus pacificus]
MDDITDEMRTEVKGTAFWITIDNPKRANALSVQIYEELIRAFDAANAHEDTIITVMIGEGKYYSSGKDLNPKEMATHDHANLDIEAGYSRFIRRIIMHRKVLIGLVSGPVMGIAYTTVGLFDYVVCADSTYFLCPFTTIGVCCEGVSSAMEMLLFNEPMTAEQALRRGYASKIFPKDEFVQKATQLVEKFSKLPKYVGSIIPFEYAGLKGAT